MLFKLLPVILMLGWAWFTMRSSEKGLLRDLDRKSTPLDSGPLLSALRRFRGAMDAQDIRVAIYEQDAINGLAAPDGRIVLTRGLVDRYREGTFTVSELAAVIAHEIGHVALGHVARRKRAWQAEMAVKAAAGFILPPALMRVVNMGWGYLARFFHMGLSRRDEYEADAFAVALMKRAGFDPRASVTLLEKLDRMGNGGAPIEWLASHPANTKRIAAVERAIEGTPKP
jgi:putative metalloprotease